MLISHLKCLF